MTAPSAWTIQAALALANAALQRLEHSGDTDESDLAAYLAQEAPEVDAVLLRLLRAAGEAEANVDAVQARMLALDAREERFKRQKTEYRLAAAGILDVLGLTKWKHAEFTVSVSPGRAGVVVTDESALADRFVRVTRTPDKGAIKAALEAGEEVAGAVLANGPMSMTVRTK